MLLLDYQNVLIESLLKDRFAGCALPRQPRPGCQVADTTQRSARQH
jgi:hypothetical protein